MVTTALQATPRPWTLEVVKTSIGRVFKIGPLGHGAKRYACLYDDSYAGIANGDEQVKANAELIVRAVNERDSLLNALDDVLHLAVNWGCAPERYTEHEREVIIRAEQMLKGGR